MRNNIRNKRSRTVYQNTKFVQKSLYIEHAGKTMFSTVDFNLKFKFCTGRLLMLKVKYKQNKSQCIILCFGLIHITWRPQALKGNLPTSPKTENTLFCAAANRISRRSAISTPWFQAERPALKWLLDQ